MNRLFSTVFFCLLCLFCFAQQDTALYVTYGGIYEDEFNSVIQDDDDNLVFCGSTSSVGDFGNKGLILKTDTLLNLIWSSLYAESGVASFNEVVENGEGYLALGSILNPQTSYDILLVQFSSEGEVEWDKTYGGDDWDFGNSLAPVNGGFLITGETNSSNPSADGYVLKINSEGEVIWENIFSTEDDEYLTDGRETVSGRLTICGVVEKNDSTSRQWFLDLDADGAINHELHFGNEGLNRFNAVANHPVEDYTIVLGEIYNPNNESIDGELRRINNEAATVWVDTAGFNEEHRWVNGEIGLFNEIICIGRILEPSFGNEGEDFFVRRMTGGGTFLGQNTYGTSGDDYPNDGIRIANGYVYVGETDGSGNGQSDGFIIRTRNDGLDSNAETVENDIPNTEVALLLNDEDFIEKELYFSNENNELIVSEFKGEVLIYDSSGRIVKKIEVSPRGVYEVNLNSGLYIFTSVGEVRSTFRAVVE